MLATVPSLFYHDGSALCHLRFFETKTPLKVAPLGENPQNRSQNCGCGCLRPLLIPRLRSFFSCVPFAEGGPQHLSGAIVVSVDSLTWVAMASAALRPSTIATKYFTLLSAPDTCLMHPALKFEL